ncbi:MAG: hypothetical protein HC923_04415 [Myxococcales bacterium]|nr:hypothetical protein [Myxococcales bacterium]
MSVLQRLKEAYDQERERVLASAEQVSKVLASASKPNAQPDVPKAEALAEAARFLARRHDPIYGGFGSAPKFPRPSTYELLLRYGRRAQDGMARQIVTTSLTAMADGGIYDHVGGASPGTRRTTDGWYLTSRRCSTTTPS